VKGVYIYTCNAHEGIQLPMLHFMIWFVKPFHHVPALAIQEGNVRCRTFQNNL